MDKIHCAPVWIESLSLGQAISAAMWSLFPTIWFCEFSPANCEESTHPPLKQKARGGGRLWYPRAPAEAGQHLGLLPGVAAVAFAPVKRSMLNPVAQRRPCFLLFFEKRSPFKVDQPKRDADYFFHMAAGHLRAGLLKIWNPDKGAICLVQFNMGIHFGHYGENPWRVPRGQRAGPPNAFTFQIFRLMFKVRCPIVDFSPVAKRTILVGMLKVRALWL